LLNIPVTTSWGARGALCEDNDLSVPMIHIVANNKIRTNSDLILTLGSRMGETDWWGKQPYWGDPATQKMIQVDLDEENIGRNKPADLPVVSDIKTFLQDLAEVLKSRKSEINLQARRAEFEPFLKEIKRDRAKLDKNLENAGAPLHSSHLATIAKKKFENNAFAVFDGGNTAVWGQMYYKCTTPGAGLGTPKMGMLGAGVGQALGAAAAFPDRQVYCITGDGAMGYHTQEIETAVRNDLKPIFIVACDKQWGMVKMTQQVTYKPLKTVIKKSLDEGETINGDFGEIAFDKLAESMGGHGERVSSPDELEKAIERCIKANKCSVIHVDVDPVKHMWAPGLLHFKNMHAEPKGK
ncbi:MAG: thiamine pyrophosphate-dependent enzyme, partial [Flavobacteriales bacterium]|nr:thiamine pyrophosphate-dependent enzyme [Flavobacteriales bacterium]